MGPVQITATHEHRYHDQHLDLDFEHETALRDTKPLRLTRKEYDLLALLIQNAGEVVTRETMLLRVWGYSNQIRTRTLDGHIRLLRKKLGEHSGTYIETIFSIGYRFQPFRVPRLMRRAPQMTALLHTKPLGLTRKEYDLLALLIQNAGEVVTRETLLLRVWGYSNQIRTRTLDVHIRRLRKKLGEHSGTYIETIFSVGYRFQPSRIEPPVVVP